ncbi:FAD-binding protein [Verrucomicrobiales bacterium]|nr:FAD-binding protein [Verrucomicrobiales bacterium]
MKNLKNRNSHGWLEGLELLLPGNLVRTDPATIEAHSQDRWHAAEAPSCVVLAKSTSDVQKTLQFAHLHEIPVTARGAGVGYVGGCVPIQRGIALSLAEMNSIKEIHVEDGVAIVEPGVITNDLQQAVLEKGLFYPPDPASLKECSLGGNVATNAGGPRCVKYGVTRQYILGLEVVLADGQVLQCGSRCHKNKTGFDLVGMFVGSEGMLGIVTEVTLRLLPNPPARAMISCSFREFHEAANAVQRVLGAGHLPSALEISDKFTLQAAREHVGRELIPDGDAHLLLEIDGQESSVQSECAQLEKLLDELNVVTLASAVTEEECERIWEIRRAFSYSLRATGLTKLNEDIVVPRGRLVDLAKFSEQLQEETGYSIASFGHAGDGNIHVNIMVPPMENESNLKQVDEALDRLFTQILAWGGVVSGEHGIGLAKKRWFSQAVSPVAMQVHQTMKQALDPKGILNPGKFLG